MDLETVEDAVKAFSDHLKEMPRTMHDGRQIDNIKDYSEADYDMLNQDWADWLDSHMADGNAPEGAQAWDWEDVV